MKRNISFSCDEVTVSSDRVTSGVFVYLSSADMEEIFEDLNITEIVDLCNSDELLKEVTAGFNASVILDYMDTSEIIKYLEDKGYSVKEED